MSEINDLHKPFIAWLRKNDLLYVYHRTDRRSGIAEGHPDFTVFLHDEKVCCVEFKTPKTGKLSPKQKERIDDLILHGTPTAVFIGLEDAIRYVEAHRQSNEPQSPPEREKQPPNGQSEPKFFIIYSPLIGSFVCTENPDGRIVGLRRASEVDLETLPRR